MKWYYLCPLIAVSLLLVGFVLGGRLGLRLGKSEAGQGNDPDEGNRHARGP